MTPSTIHAGSVVVRNADILFSKVDDELLAIDVESGYCYSLNDSAGKIWAMMEESVLVGDLTARLCKDYAVDEDTCVQDTIELLCDLQKDGLVKISDA